MTPVGLISELPQSDSRPQQNSNYGAWLLLPLAARNSADSLSALTRALFRTKEVVGSERADLRVCDRDLFLADASSPEISNVTILHVKVGDLKIALP